MKPTSAAIRFQFQSNKTSPEFALHRYNIMSLSEPGVGAFNTSINENQHLKIERYDVHLHAKRRTISVHDNEDQKWRCTYDLSESNGGSGFHLQISLDQEEYLYGLGDISRDRIERRGLVAEMSVKDDESFTPIPYVMSSRGWAIIVNTLYSHTMDLDSDNSRLLTISGSQDVLDFYLLLGSDYTDLLDQYKRIIGPSPMLPIWAYGLTFLCNQTLDAQGIILNALEFRKMNIPCDLIVLDGWTETSHDYSTQKQWDPKRLLRSEDNKRGSFSLFGTLRKHGFKTGIVIGCDHDLSAYEEQLLSHNPSIPSEPEPWYEHLQSFVEDGVSAFKLIGATLSDKGRNRTWANNMTSEQMNNLYPVLLGKQMHQGYAEQTGLRPMIYTNAGYTAISRYAATYIPWKESNQSEFVTAILNHGLSGQVHTTSDMDVNSPEGIHFGFLLPWTQINSWAYFHHPSFLEENLQRLFKTYAHLRYRLLPYLYTTAYTATQTGMPIIRAMPLMFPDDPMCRTLNQQYMLGEFLLVAVFTEQVYLPEGKWIDYWTGKQYTGPLQLQYRIPEGVGGPLFIRGGAIIPMWPLMDFIGQYVAETIYLHIYPYGQSHFTLYEDDGSTYQYSTGSYATVQIRCSSEANGITVYIERRQGIYEQMPANRYYTLHIYLHSEPGEVRCNDETCLLLKSYDTLDNNKGWIYDLAQGVVKLRIKEPDEQAGTAKIDIRYKKNRKGLRHTQRNAKHPSSVEHGEESKLLTALRVGQFDEIYTALQSWWDKAMDETQATLDWKIHLMEGCALMIRHIQQQDWKPNEVLGPDLEKSFKIHEISSPENGFQLLKLFAQHIVTFTWQIGKQTTHPVVQEAIQILRQEIQHKLSLQDVAQRLHVHPAHLSRLFHQETEQTFSNYLCELRMRRARAMLAAGMKVYEVASLNGYADPAYFSRAFRKYWGVSPEKFKTIEPS